MMSDSKEQSPTDDPQTSIAQLSLEEVNKGHEGQEKKDIEKVTDYAEEAEVDSTKLTQAMNFLSDVGKSNNAQISGKDKQDAVSKEDVEVLVHELQVSKSTAEKALREASGNFKEAFKSLLTRNSYV